jgi:hypothetical protein
MDVNATLLATLGQEPQVVTLALDHLLATGEPINRVVVIYSDPTYVPVANSLAALQQEFKTYPLYCDSGIPSARQSESTRREQKSLLTNGSGRVSGWNFTKRRSSPVTAFAPIVTICKSQQDPD